MKKVILLLAICMTAFTVNAQVFVENFATATVGANLEGYNEWYVSFKVEDANGTSPKIGEDPLFYTGYAGSNLGHVALLDSVIGTTSATQRISTKRIIFASGDTLKPGTTGAIYSAFMVNISTNSYRSYRDFFTYEGSEGSSFTRGRVFAKNTTAGDQVMFSVTKNSSTTSILDANSTTTLGLTLGTGVNHLLVVKYEIIDAASNDVITLFVNPDLTKTEAEQTNKLITSDSQSDYSATTPMKINLRQRGIGAQIGGIRVGRSWDSVVLGIGSGFNQPNLNNNIYASGKSVYTNESGNLTIYNLSGAEVLTTKTIGKFETSLSKGMYLVKFISDNGFISSGKIQLK